MDVRYYATALASVQYKAFLRALYHSTKIINIRGWPTWDDRFSQYGINVSFWGSGTLKIVIYVKKLTPRNEVFGWLIIPPSGWGC